MEHKVVIVFCVPQIGGLRLMSIDKGGGFVLASGCLFRYEYESDFRGYEGRRCACGGLLR